MPRPTNQERAFKIAIGNPTSILDNVDEYSEYLVEYKPNHFRGLVLSIDGKVGIVTRIKYEPITNWIYSVVRVYEHKDIIATK